MSTKSAKISKLSNYSLKHMSTNKSGTDHSEYAHHVLHNGKKIGEVHSDDSDQQTPSSHVFLDKGHEHHKVNSRHIAEAASSSIADGGNMHVKAIKHTTGRDGSPIKDLKKGYSMDKLEKQLEDKIAELKKTRDELIESLEKAKHIETCGKMDSKKDQKIIAEALDDHNEKKHGEDKDEDSAMEKANIMPKPSEKPKPNSSGPRFPKPSGKPTKPSIKNDIVKFEKNGQWSMEKTKATSDYAQRVAPGGRKSAFEHQGYNNKKEFQGNKEITPQKQIDAKKQSKIKSKVAAEKAAAERRAEYRKSGELK